jgi:uncharacterized membrane protein
MSQIIESVDVGVPVRTAYDQWTQFEEFPLFMEGVEKVEQVDDTQIAWTANIDGIQKSWVAEITEQIPDERIAWRAIEGAQNAGVVTFDRLADDRTRVTLQLDVEPEGPVEKVGDALGFVARRARGDMERFKRFIESRGTETGAWRGTVSQGSR